MHEPPGLTNLGRGEHSLAVRAKDDLLNQGAAVTRTFTVDTAPPDTTLLDAPAEGSTSPSATTTFTFASPESTATFQCRLDEQAFAACTSPTTLENLTNGDHTFQVRAVDQAGNPDATPATRAWRVNTLDADADGINRPQDCNDGNPAIRPGAADVPDNGLDEDCSGADAVNPDRDADGINRPQDCDDANPAIRPGATDVPGDGVDQDCSGADAPVPPVSASITYTFRVRGSRTTVALLRLSKLAPDARVKATCKGKRCPIRSATAKPSRAGVVDVRRLLKRKPLSAGSKLTLTISAPGHVTKVATFTMRRGKTPSGGKLACLPAGAKKPVAC